MDGDKNVVYVYRMREREGNGALGGKEMREVREVGIIEVR